MRGRSKGDTAPYEVGRSEMGDCKGRAVGGPNRLLKEGSCCRWED